MFTWEKSKQVISTQTLNENRIPMFWLGLFPVKAIPLILTSSLKAIIPQYHFLTLVLCHNFTVNGILRPSLLVTRHKIYRIYMQSTGIYHVLDSVYHKEHRDA